MGNVRKIDRVEIALITGSLLTATIAVTALIFALAAFSGRLEAQRYADSRLKATIIRECESQNYRHDSTISFLEQYAAAYEKSNRMSPEKRTRLAAQIRANVTLINDLQPHRDCSRLLG